MADLFVCSSSGDVALVDRCVAWLRTFGVTVCTARSDEDSNESSVFRAACFFVSEASIEEPELVQVLQSVVMTNRPVLMVLLDDIPMSKLRKLPVLDLQTLHVEGLKPARIGEALVGEFYTIGVLRAPVRKVLRPCRPNEFRKTVVWRARARFAAVAVMVLSLAYLVRSWSGERSKAGQPAKAVTTQPPGAPAPATHPQPKQAPEAPPPVVLNEREARAIEFVRQCMDAPTREQGMTEAQIDRIVSFFADPVFIDGVGKQPRALLRSSMLQRARELPRYREAVEKIKVEPSLTPSTVRVLVKASYYGENREAGTEARGGLILRYVVQFDEHDTPLIVRLEEEKSWPE